MISSSSSSSSIRANKYEYPLLVLSHPRKSVRRRVIYVQYLRLANSVNLSFESVRTPLTPPIIPECSLTVIDLYQWQGHMRRRKGLLFAVLSSTGCVCSTEGCACARMQLQVIFYGRPKNMCRVHRAPSGLPWPVTLRRMNDAFYYVRSSRLRFAADTLLRWPTYVRADFVHDVPSHTCVNTPWFRRLQGI